MSKELEKIGYEYDEDFGGHFKDLYFDYNKNNLDRRLGTLLYCDKKIKFFKGRLFDVCENANEIIKEEQQKLEKTLNIKIEIIGVENNE